MIRRTMLVAVLAGSAAAQQVLYEPLPPAGSAYLRIVNATAGPLVIRRGTGGGDTLSADAAGRVSPYTVQENVADRPVELALNAGAVQATTTLRLDPGSFNTLIAAMDGAALSTVAFTDQTQFNQTRARLTFYNATLSCPVATLTLDPEGQAVFSDVAAGTGRMRSVNPVTARVRVACGAIRSAPFPLGAMEAGGQYSVWLIAPRGEPLGFVTRDTTAPWRR